MPGSENSTSRVRALFLELRLSATSFFDSAHFPLDSNGGGVSGSERSRRVLRQTA